MQQKLSRLLMLLVVLALAACGGAPKRVSMQAEKPGAQTVLAPVLTPEDQARFQQAVSGIQNGQLNEAEMLLKALLQAYPSLAGALTNLGYIRQSQGQQEEAREYFEQALAINPENIGALFAMAAFDMEAGDFELAESKYLMITDRHVDHAKAHYNLGVLYELYLQRYDDAIVHYESYVRLAETDDVKTVERWIKLLERK